MAGRLWIRSVTVVTNNPAFGLNALGGADFILMDYVHPNIVINCGAGNDRAKRKLGISEQTFYRWKKSYGGMLPSEARELKQLRDENLKLKRLVADLSLDKVMLQDVVQKKF